MNNATMSHAANKLTNTPCVLIIRDGWGQNPNAAHDAFNAVKLAHTPVADRLMREYPNTLIKTSGMDVGLPEDTMGNSEVGHQNIGAGRIVDQESVRITRACRAGKLASNEALASALDAAKQRGGKDGALVHLMCICSDAGVHGLLEHLFAVIKACKERGVPSDRVALHLFTDGRDTGPFTGLGFVKRVEAALREIGGGQAAGQIVSVIGRYWSMDRDFRWERVHRAYACLTGRDAAKHGVRTETTATAGVQWGYDNPAGETLKGDEFTPPTMVGPDDAARARSRVKDGDAVIFVNYRGDRPREIVSAFVLPDDQWAKVKPSPDSGTPGFPRGAHMSLDFVCMTAYSEALNPHVKVAFPKPPKMVDIAGAAVSGLGLTQFRCAETEKFPHVTFFFNDYRDEPFPGEQRAIIQSPKVATYDMQPEMSAAGVRDAVLERLRANDCEPFIVVNFANGDMVGHTGSLPATIKACECVDACVGAIVDATLARGGSLVVTADHGNAEQMFDPATNNAHTAHTTYDVPLIVVGAAFKGRKLKGPGEGRLADVVPTMFDMMSVSKPAAMEGESLLLPG
ncbi:MAG: 2,3-bisphosphoglycerate-independent phosphoglycerate mutase [Phycisphaerales bacterium]